MSAPSTHRLRVEARVMTQSWYPFYVGDYARKTAHLSLLEHGAYRLLLDHYYSTGLPLPDDNTKLFRICRARTPSERQSVLSTVAEFFTKDGTLLRSKKCDRVLDKQLNYSNSQSANAKRRHSHGTATAMLHARVTRTRTKEEVSSYKVEFENFWDLYPTMNRSKGSKKDALAAYEVALKKTNHETIMKGINNYAAYIQNTGQSNADAFRWLQHERWADDYTYATGKPSVPTKPTKIDLIAQGVAAARAKRIAREQEQARPDDSGLPINAEALWQGCSEH